MPKIKVLMVLGNTGRGGAQTFAMNVLRMIDLDRFQVDFAVNEIKDNGYTEEIYSFGSKIHVIPFFKGYNWAKYIQAWNKILSENEYDIIHGHVSSSAAIYLKTARKHGCKTIAHSHSAGYRGSRFEQVIKKLFTIGARDQADYWFACSKPAAVRMFGKEYYNNPNYYDIPNAIIADRYLFSEGIRDRIRSTHNFSNNQKVYGHVGSFTAPKNHQFLLEVFFEILKKDPKAVLLIAGEGELEKAIVSKIDSLGIGSNVIMVGNVSNVNEYMMAMDTMIFPSFFEGFPITVLEAQATGLPIVLSDTITEEVILTSSVYPMALNEGAYAWSCKCIEVKNDDRSKMNVPIACSKYNMKNCVEQIMLIYDKLFKEQ